MSSRAALIALVVATSSCSKAPSAPPVPNEAAAKQAVAARFVYSNSVEFRGVRPGKFGGSVCGEVKGKKRDGGSGDWLRFAWQKGHEPTIEGEPYSAQSEALAKLDDEILTLVCGATFER